MNLSKLLGPSWTTTLTGALGGVSIAAWPIISSAVNTQMTGVRVDWSNVLIGAAVAILGYFAKAHNVSNSPTPLAIAQPIVPVTAPTTGAPVAVPLAQPVVVAAPPQPEPPHLVE